MRELSGVIKIFCILMAVSGYITMHVLQNSSMLSTLNKKYIIYK
jgi:hypothetical protein